MSQEQSIASIVFEDYPTPKLIAWYLPQFHPIPENDVFWGTGFTEWPNVARAKPLFPGHYQPRIPSDLGFYDLRLPEVREAQARLAREYGIHGFCYYHYWFEGRRVLERPLDEVIETGHPDFPFCLCWANHNWSWKRDINTGHLILQDYSEEDDREHIRWLLDVFEDERYIRVNGRPLFLIYRAHSMPNSKRTTDIWREEAEKKGVAEPYICKVDSMGNFGAPENFGCDAAVEFWPHGMGRIAGRLQGEDESYETNKIYEYRDVMKRILAREVPPFRRYPCVVPQWDNTARKPMDALILHNSTPNLYKRWLQASIEKISFNPPDEQLVFINAWNEWGEAAYLEPDFEHGRAYLEATKQALEAVGAKAPSQIDTEDVGIEVSAPAPSSVEKLYGDLLEKYTQLQQSYVDRLSNEEQSPLVQLVEQRAKKLEQKYSAQTQRTQMLRARQKKQNRLYKKLKEQNRKSQKQVTRLQSQLEQSANSQWNTKLTNELNLWKKRIKVRVARLRDYLKQK